MVTVPFAGGCVMVGGARVAGGEEVVSLARTSMVTGWPCTVLLVSATGLGVGGMPSIKSMVECLGSPSSLARISQTSVAFTTRPAVVPPRGPVVGLASFQKESVAPATGGVCTGLLAVAICRYSTRLASTCVPSQR
ncbi:hypothetical protein D3C72_1537990 [compost metagenome]